MQLTAKIFGTRHQDAVQAAELIALAEYALGDAAAAAKSAREECVWCGRDGCRRPRGEPREGFAQLALLDLAVEVGKDLLATAVLLEIALEAA